MVMIIIVNCEDLMCGEDYLRLNESVYYIGSL